MPGPMPCHPVRLPPEQSLRERFAGRIVLLVDDDEINREIGIGLLDRAGLRVRTAVDGSDALQAIGRERFDLILMDVQMPIMDGIEATRRIRLCADRRTVPIIALTADPRFSDPRQVAACGMDDGVSKPIDPDLLFAAILKWLSKGRSG